MGRRLICGFLCALTLTVLGHGGLLLAALCAPAGCCAKACHVPPQPKDCCIVPQSGQAALASSAPQLAADAARTIVVAAVHSTTSISPYQSVASASAELAGRFDRGPPAA